MNIVKEEDKDTTRYSGLYYNFEIFCIREKEIPVDSLEIKENCYAFAWEPNGQRFAIIYGEGTNRTTAAFYRIEPANGSTAGKLVLIKELKNRTCLQLSWSPNGQYCVLATDASKQSAAGCSCEFVDVQANDVVSMNKMEQEHMTDFEWDPTGRYFVTYISYWNYRSENTYMMWNFQGKSISKQPFDRLYKLSWRPRPVTPLTPEQIKEVRKNLKQYSEKYNAADRLYLSRVSKELLDKRRKMYDDFSSFRHRAAKRFRELTAKRIELRRGQDTESHDQEENDEDYIEYTVQFLVESKKEEVAPLE
jgi:translation initiation factor 3 subunit B